jgi:hypothetical protein
MGLFRFLLLFDNVLSCRWFSASKGFRFLLRCLIVLMVPFFTVDLHTVGASTGFSSTATNAASSNMVHLPSGNGDLMFYVQRNVDDKQVHYVLNTSKDGNLNVKEPFQIFWVNVDASSNKSTSKLNLIQRRLVYGVRVQAVDNERVDFNLAAYPDIILSLIPKNGHYQVFTTINGVFCRLQYIHVELADKNTYNPTVRYVRLVGTDKQGNRVTGDIFE